MRLWHAETSFFIIGTTNRDAMHKVLLTLTMLHVASIHAMPMKTIRPDRLYSPQDCSSSPLHASRQHLHPRQIL